MIETITLASGLRVVTEELDHVRSVSIGIWVKAGSCCESEETNGTAHFLEHMLFKGTERRSAFDIASAIDSVGGVMNAYTGKELTSFFVKVPDYHLPTAVDLLGDIFLHSRFDPAEMEKEKQVILQEISMLEDAPDDYIHDLFEAAFWDGHCLGLPVLGRRHNIEALTREGLVSFFRRHYHGANTVLAAAGRLRHETFAALAQEAFASLNGGGAEVKREAARPAPRVRALEKDLEQIHMIVGTLAPSAVDEDRYAGFVLNSVLGGSMSSRLFQEIRERRGLAYDVHSFIVPYLEAGLFGVYVGVGRGQCREVLGLILDEMRRMTHEPLGERELAAAKELIKGHLLLGMESTDNRMTRLAKNEICFGRQVPTEEVIAGIDAVTADGVRDLAARMFDPGVISVSALGPVTEQELTLHILSV